MLLKACWVSQISTQKPEVVRGEFFILNKDSLIAKVNSNKKSGPETAKRQVN
jgi:hypothetical protein